MTNEKDIYAITKNIQYADKLDVAAEIWREEFSNARIIKIEGYIDGRKITFDSIDQVLETAAEKLRMIYRKS